MRRPRSRVLTSALVAALLASLAGIARAQLYQEARDALDFGPDPVARSARLLGMGRMTLVVDDPHNRIGLWDFAGNPIGVAMEDSGSAFELRPGTASHSEVRDLDPGFQRQVLAGNEYRVGYEGWRRTREGTAYGAIGDLGMLRIDQPYSTLSERRSSLSDPNLEAVIAGHVPWVLKSPRWRYALSALAIKETSADEYRLFVVNPTGQYIDRNGAILDQPQILMPTDYDVFTLGGGLSLGYDFGPVARAAVGGQFLEMDVQGTNDGKRYHTGTHERRPLTQGQASIVGRIAGHLEYGADGRLWSSNSPTNWDFSQSLGVGNALTERGTLGRRAEFGSSFRSRVRWVQGPFEIGGGLSTGFERLTVTPPDPSDPFSFNRILQDLYYFFVANPSLGGYITMPDSVVYNRAEERTRDFGGALAYRLPWRQALVAAEVHGMRDDFVQTVSGEGPRRQVTELRTGVELGLAPSIQGRGGWFYRTDNRDIFTYGNKYTGDGITLGIGVHPARSVWSFDAGYLLYWYRVAVGDPSQPHGSRQQFLGQLRWAL